MRWAGDSWAWPGAAGCPRGGWSWDTKPTRLTCRDLLSCWTEYWTCHSSVMRRLLCLELIDSKSPQWQNMDRKGLMCINTGILKCNRCTLPHKMYRFQRNYSNSYSPITGKCIKKKKSFSVDIFVTTHFRTAVVTLGIYFQKYIQKNSLLLAANYLKAETTVQRGIFQKHII